MNKFKINDRVTGLQYPDLLPAKVIELIKPNFVKIEFEYKGKKRSQILPEYRLRYLN